MKECADERAEWRVSAAVSDREETRFFLSQNKRLFLPFLFSLRSYSHTGKMIRKGFERMRRWPGEMENRSESLDTWEIRLFYFREAVSALPSPSL